MISEFYAEELSVMESIPDGLEYYDYIIKNVDIDRSNPNNSHYMYHEGKVDKLDPTQPCKFVKPSTALPDIDTDFPTNFREKIIDYVKEKYGHDKVSQISTFGRLVGRSAVKTVLRTMDLCDPYTQNVITEHIPDEAAISDELEAMEHPSVVLWAVENVKELADYCYIENGELKGEYAEAFQIAIQLEGTFQTCGQHAAGVIISSEPIRNICPTTVNAAGNLVANMDMSDIEKIGGVKFDFLGVDILNKIHEVVGDSILSIPMDDEEVFELIQSGNTKGCFQIEGKLGMDWAQELKPRNIEELAALISIIRPGTLASKDATNRSMTKVYCDRKNEIEVIPETEINRVIDTYGVIIYQETLLKIARVLAGFNSAESIVLMKCVSADSLVYTRNGPKRIDEITHNDFILNIVDGKHNYSKIKRVWSTGKRKVLRISTSNGFSIDLTENHQILTNVGWLQAKDITKNHFIIIPKRYNPQNNRFINKNLTILTAYFLSEGCYTEKSPNPKITNQDVSVIELLEQIIISEFGQEQCKRYLHKNGVIDLRLLGDARKFIQANFYKVKSKDKIIPDFIMGANEDIKRIFVSCFFNAEGSFNNLVDNHHIEISSASQNILRQIQAILLQDGIHAGISVKYNKKYCRNYYRLTISSVDDIKIFISLYLDFLSNKKKLIFEQFDVNREYLRNNAVKKYRIPKNIIESCFGGGILREKIKGNFAVTREDYSTLSVEKATRLNEFVKSEVLDALISSDFYYVQVNSIKELDNEVLVYDYETEDETHCGFINGILVHNSVGKKDAKKLFALEEQFLSGCKRVGKITEDEAKGLFDNIKASARYLFNKSHAVEYAYIAYWSAYVKKYHPLKFYRTWLEYSKHKLEPHLEVKNLVISARNDGITIEPPSAKYLTADFFIKENSVHFGLTHIKGVSRKELDKLFQSMIEHGINSDLSTYLLKIFPNVGKTTIIALIKVGAFGFLSIPRSELLHYYECTLQYSDSEIKKLSEIHLPFLEAAASSCQLKKLGGIVHSVTRLQKVQDIVDRLTNPGRSLTDTPAKIAIMEDDLIGIPLSCGYLDQCLSQGIADTTCREFTRGKTGKMSIVGIVKEAKEHKTKKGDPMCFITLADDTGEINAVMFKEYADHSSKIYESAMVAVFGERKKNSFIINRVVEL